MTTLDKLEEKELQDSIKKIQGKAFVLDGYVTGYIIQEKINGKPIFGITKDIADAIEIILNHIAKTGEL